MKLEMRDPRKNPLLGDTIYGPGGWRKVIAIDSNEVAYEGHRKPDGATVCLGTWRRWARGCRFERVEDAGPRVTMVYQVEIKNPRPMAVIRGYKE